MAKILVVEDEPLIRLVLAEELAEQGHVVLDCGNVLEALAALGRHDDFDVVITDVDMPGGLSGLDLVRLLKGMKPHVKIWVTSGRPVDTAGLGADVAFLAKPYDIGKLAGAIAACCCGQPIAQPANYARAC